MKKNIIIYIILAFILFSLFIISTKKFVSNYIYLDNTKAEKNFVNKLTHDIFDFTGSIIKTNWIDNFCVITKNNIHLVFIFSWHYSPVQTNIDMFRKNYKNFIIFILDPEPMNLTDIILEDNDIIVSAKNQWLPKGGQHIFFPYFSDFMNSKKLTVDNFKYLQTNPIKTKFCFFAYSNCDDKKFDGVAFRKKFYNTIQYLSNNRVDNYGKCYGGNTNGHYTNNDQFLQSYKFVIAIENQFLTGYITEKLLNPILAGSVPIYMGAPDVCNYINPKRFINIRNFIDMEHCIKYVLSIENDIERYKKILEEPIWVNPNMQYIINPRIYLYELLQKTSIPKFFLRYIPTNGSKIALCTFSDGKIYKHNRIVKEAIDSLYFDNIFAYTLDELDDTFLKNHYKFISSNKRGYGYWIWKPEVILTSLNKLNNGDLLIWADSGNTIRSGFSYKIKQYAEEVDKSNHGILSFSIKHISIKWTKMDTIEHIIDSEIENEKDKNDVKSKIINNEQVTASLLVIRKSESSIKLIEKWKKYMNNYHLIDDSPSKKPNHHTFIENRHDQSVLDIICKIYNVPINRDVESDNYQLLKNIDTDAPILATRKK